MVALASEGIHFKDPWLLLPTMSAAANYNVVDVGGSGRTSATAEFFTEMAGRGLQDQTNWTANTYKTILSVPSGKGLVAAYIGCTAGGAETHTVELTVDGKLVEIAIGTLASGERAALLPGCAVSGIFASGTFIGTGVEVLEADKATIGALSGTNYIPPWSIVAFFGIPLLRFNRSLLVRAKHSATITNSTATAYSGVMYRLGLGT